MRKLVLLALVGIVALSLLPQAAAQDERFAVRFGLIVLEPTGDTTTMGDTREMATGYGATGIFEWYFADRFGLEGALAMGVDADVKENGDVVAGVSAHPLTVGLNWHPVRTATIDWGIGALAGVILYTDFEFKDSGSGTSSTVNTEDDTTYGLQTFLDVGFAKGGRWGMSFGLKYLVSDLEVDTEKVAIDPLIVSVMGKFHF